MNSQHPDRGMKEQIQRIEEIYRDKGLPPNFCTVPFTTFNLNPDGTVSGCRMKGSDFVIGDLKTQTIDEIWNSEFMQSWRREFLDGKPQICAFEVENKSCHLSTADVKTLDSFNFSPCVEGPILKLGANFNGRCNSRCQMCLIWKQPSGLYDQLGFWRIAEEKIFPFLSEIDLFSGEPFIQDDTFRLIEIMAKVNPNCLWTITTNLNWQFTSTIAAQLDRVLFKNIIVSIDSLRASTLAKIRPGVDLSLMTQTLDELILYARSRQYPFEIVANNLIQRDNVYELQELFEFVEAKGIQSFRSAVYRPPEFSLFTLELSERIKILDYYFSHFSTKTLLRSLNILKPLINELELPLRKSYLAKLLQLEIAHG